jgi:PAS domain S-box-containing protein
MTACRPEEGIDYRFIANASLDWDSWITPERRPAWISPSVEPITGYGLDECLGMADYPMPIIDARDHGLIRQIIDDGLNGGQGNDLRIRVQHKRGALAWVAFSWRPMPQVNGLASGVRLSARDLRDSHADRVLARYQDAQTRLSRGGLLDLEDRRAALRAIAECSARALDIVRVGVWLMTPARDAIVAELIHDLPSGHECSGQRVARADFPSYFKALDQDRVIAATDAWYDPRTAELVEAYLAPLGIRAMLDAPIVLGGRTVGVICHEHLGTRRHWSIAEISFATSMADFAAMVLDAEARRELESLHRQLAAIIEATPDFVGTAGLDGRPTYINLAGRRLVGLEPGEPLAGWSVDNLYADWARAQRDRVSIPTALREGVWSGESLFKTRHDEPFPVSQVIIAHRDALGRPTSMSTVARDLRPWKTIEADLRERERSLATLVSNLPGVAYRRRNAPGWPMEYISQGCLELTGYRAEQLLANDPRYNDIVHPDDHDRLYAEVDAALAEGRPFNAEYRLLRADGREIWVWSKGRGIHDDSGRLVAREGFIGDITERVAARMELERLNADLEARVVERTERLRAANQQLESFTYSVSHDLKAPLRGIDGYSRLLIEDYATNLPEEARGFLDNIRAASGRMNQLIDDLLAYSRLERRDLDRRQVRLERVLERLLAEREIEISAHGAEVTVEVDDIEVFADGEALAQALRNLIDNAIKFSSLAAPPRIHIRAVAEGDRVELSITDNGCGFDMKYHDLVFDIFQRLHRVEDYPGTGVGLAIVRKAVERMGGRVWAHAQPGCGATFHLELPT